VALDQTKQKLQKRCLDVEETMRAFFRKYMVSKFQKGGKWKEYHNMFDLILGEPKRGEIMETVRRREL